MEVNGIKYNFLSDKPVNGSGTYAATDNNIQQPVINCASSQVGDSVEIRNMTNEWAKIENSDGKIGNFRQGQTGDCWFLATLLAIQMAGRDEEFISSRIKRNGNAVNIAFGCGEDATQYNFTQEDINQRLLKTQKSTDYTAKYGDTLSEICENFGADMQATAALEANEIHDVNKIKAGRKYTLIQNFGNLASNDVDVMMLEMALEQTLKKPIDGNYPSFAIRNIAGRPITYIDLDTGNAACGHENSQIDKTKSLYGLMDYALKRKDNLGIVASTGKTVSPNSGLYPTHAYTVDLQESNENYIVVINPHNTNEKRIMPKQQFMNNFSYISIADLSSYESYTVQEEECLSVIAQKHNLKTEDLILANPELKNVDIIRTGEQINIPVK